MTMNKFLYNTTGPVGAASAPGASNAGELSDADLVDIITSTDDNAGSKSTEKKYENTYDSNAPKPKSAEEEKSSAEEKAKLERQQRAKDRLKSLSQLVPMGIKWANKEFAIPAHRELTLKKRTKQEQEEYWNWRAAIKAKKSGAAVTIPVLSENVASIIDDLEEYRDKAIFDEKAEQDISDAIKDVMDYYDKPDVKVHPLLSLGITVAMIEGPVLFPLFAPTVKGWFTGSEPQPAIEEKKEEKTVEVKEAA